MDLFKKSKNYKGQDYNELKKQQLQRGVKFVDDEFPLESMGIYSVPVSEVELRRPADLVSVPCLLSPDSYSSLKKGFVNNFNVLLAFTSLKSCPRLWSKVFVDAENQKYDPNHPNEHPGIFRFRFWQEGSLFDVTIDDRLPCSGDKLLSVASSHASEFWPALLEKAYAK
ncbi:Calpain-1 catalytic subunit [Fasciola gigantica]|uniref:Calpain-1 catalytic subunit n=1 Tax=Fasciola gigantica TaxID=46835 RepID=A0A504YHM3_FASGI|nr:Calpain-1 catalytic subunit [Fasciola gigantica]